MLEHNRWNFIADRLWCGQTQVPASLLLNLTGDVSKAKKLSYYRIKSALALFTELLGCFFITWGFSTSELMGVLWLGLMLKISGSLASAYWQNKSGIIWNVALQTHLKDLTTYAQEVNAYLADQGCSESEIQALHFLSSDVYQAELNSYQRARLQNIGTPVACGLALLLIGQPISAVIVLLLGLCSFPIGEYFFKEHVFRNESQLRLGNSAKQTEYLQHIHNQHLAFSLRINALSQLPLVLFGVRFLFSGPAQLLSTFFGYTQGLVGLTGTFAFQKARMVSQKTTKTARHLIDVLSSSAFLLTPSRWHEHCSKPEKNLVPSNMLVNGVELCNFTVPIKNGDEHCPILLNGFISSGGMGVLQAPSGKGKSTFLMGLTHLINHDGDVFFIKNAKRENIHFFSKEELSKKIFFFRSDLIDRSTRITDMFKEVLIIELISDYQEMNRKFGTELTELAWNAADNLIESEIVNLQKGRKSAFPYQMVSDLQQMRQNRQKIVASYLAKGQGNLASPNIYPERLYITLSAGEKQRINCLLALVKARIKKECELVILDEPLTHLDKQNVQFQMNVLKQIQGLQNPPALLIISHHFVDELSEQFHHIQKFSF
ncbi:MAG: hypothetical protein H0X51_05235 [Parachlamydiaceae bacterium]|nr:hypothetical protein [Parachlamydiaceae bacterium]